MGWKSKRLKDKIKKTAQTAKKAVGQPKAFVHDAVALGKVNVKTYGPTYVKAQLAAGAALAAVVGLPVAAAAVGVGAKGADTYQSMRLQDKSPVTDPGPAMMDAEGYLIEDPGQTAYDPTAPHAAVPRPTQPPGQVGAIDRAALWIDGKIKRFWAGLMATPAARVNNSIGQGMGSGNDV